MKVVQVSYCFHPDPVGGTERYVAELARELRGRDVDAVVAAPATGPATYHWEGVPVRRFATSNRSLELRDLHGAGDATAAVEFGRLLDSIQPDLVHLHASSPGVSLRLLQAVKARRLPAVFTYHTPAVTCARGSLMQWGSTPCAGEMLVHTCARCMLHGLGMNRVAATVVGTLPVGLGVALSQAQASGRIRTALRLPELMDSRHRARRAFLDGVDHIVAVCEWGREVLLRNGVPAAKVTVSRQGVSGGGPSAPFAKPGPAGRRGADALRLAYFGRLDPLKGLEVLFRALQLTRQVPVELTIHGVAQGEEGARYDRTLRRLAANDRRIIFQGPVSSGEVIQALRRHDMLVVPSQCLETGPLVVLEAFAAGLPVMGSKLGGIAELVDDGVNGLLVAPADVPAWADALRRVSSDRDLVGRLAAGVRPPRGITHVADDAMALYARLLGAAPAAPHPGGSVACR